MEEDDEIELLLVVLLELWRLKTGFGATGGVCCTDLEFLMIRFAEGLVKGSMTGACSFGVAEVVVVVANLMIGSFFWASGSL